MVPDIIVLVSTPEHSVCEGMCLVCVQNSTNYSAHRLICLSLVRLCTADSTGVHHRLKTFSGRHSKGSIALCASSVVLLLATLGLGAWGLYEGLNATKDLSTDVFAVFRTARIKVCLPILPHATLLKSSPMSCFWSALPAVKANNSDDNSLCFLLHSSIIGSTDHCLQEKLTIVWVCQT